MGMAAGLVDTDWQTTYSWMLAFGGGVADGSSYALRTDPNLATLQFIKGLFDSHCAWLSTEPAPFDFICPAQCPLYQQRPVRTPGGNAIHAEPEKLRRVDRAALPGYPNERAGHLWTILFRAAIHS